MAIDNSKTIDFISLDGKLNTALLVISDHLDWSNSLEHQYVLEEKLNAYLAFVESGEIFERFPKALGKGIEMQIVFLHEPDAPGFRFLTKAQAIIETAGFSFSYKVGIEGPGPLPALSRI